MLVNNSLFIPTIIRYGIFVIDVNRQVHHQIAMLPQQQQPQQVVQLQRISMKDTMSGQMISVSTANSQMMRHPSPTGSLSSNPMTPRPMPPGTPGTPLSSIAQSPLQPSTPLSQDVQSPVSSDMSSQLPVITPPPPPPYPGPPPPYPSQLKVIHSSKC